MKPADGERLGQARCIWRLVSDSLALIVIVCDPVSWSEAKTENATDRSMGPVAVTFGRTAPCELTCDRPHPCRAGPEGTRGLGRSANAPAASGLHPFPRSAQPLTSADLIGRSRWSVALNGETAV